MGCRFEHMPMSREPPGPKTKSCLACQSIQDCLRGLATAQDMSDSEGHGDDDLDLESDVG